MWISEVVLHCFALCSVWAWFCSAKLKFNCWRTCLPTILDVRTANWVFIWRILWRGEGHGYSCQICFNPIPSQMILLVWSMKMFVVFAWWEKIPHDEMPMFLQQLCWFLYARKRNFGGSYFQILHSGGDHRSEKVRNMIAVNLVSFLGERNVYMKG